MGAAKKSEIENIFEVYDNAREEIIHYFDNLDDVAIGDILMRSDEYWAIEDNHLLTSEEKYFVEKGGDCSIWKIHKITTPEVQSKKGFTGIICQHYELNDEIGGLNPGWLIILSSKKRTKKSKLSESITLKKKLDEGWIPGHDPMNDYWGDLERD